MNFIEKMPLIHGNLDIYVIDHYTGEILRHDSDHNQIQDWSRNAITYLLGGRLFSTWGNHGEVVSDVGTPFSIAHYKDGKDGTSADDIVTTTPWTYSNAMEGLIQLRTKDDGDQIGATAATGTPLYPFFPTKMRFGIGGLDADQNPRTDIPTSQTSLNSVDDNFPYVLVDRNRSLDSHIEIASSGSITANNMVTFSCKLPGGDASYPYNGKVISEAGLFCDAALIPSGSANTNMRTGTMLAYRSFYGITKDESIDLIFHWSFRS